MMMDLNDLKVEMLDTLRENYADLTAEEIQHGTLLFDLLLAHITAKYINEND